VKLVALLALTGCSAAPPAPTPLPTPVALARPTMDAAPAPTATEAPGCITHPDAVSFLDADTHDVRACFALRDKHPDQCVVIDRHTSRIASDPSPPKDPLQISHPTPIRGHVAGGNPRWSICANQKCVFGIRIHDVVDREFTVSISDDEGSAVVTFPPKAATDDPHFEIFTKDDSAMPYAFASVEGDHCGSGLMLDGTAFVATSDCNGIGHAAFYALDGTIISPLSTRPDFNAYGAWPVRLGVELWAVVTPAEYQILIFDTPGLKRRDVVDLIPIQAESTPTPSFVETHAKDGTWLIASPTGGVGIIDPFRGALANAWIIPRCEDAATGP